MERDRPYILMHKNIPVAEIKLDTAAGSVSAVGEIYAKAHIPVGVAVKNGRIDRAGLNGWWRGRAIPASRDGLQAALSALGLPSAQTLPEKCLGLSLSDQYWIRPAGSGVRWESVNFFENPFSGDMGNLLLGKGASEGISLMSPDNTSDGWLRKKWSVINGKRCLIKGGSGATQQEPYNEAFASRVMERLGIPHVPYTLFIQDDYPYSVCEDFVTPQTELISAWYIMQTRRRENHVSVYRHYLNCCDALGIPGVRDSLDRMLALDYLLVNEDRHQNNFGVLRHAETLEYLGAAPLYDSGTSLWFDKPIPLIGSVRHVACKPFKTSHDEQIQLVSSFDWLDLSALSGMDEEFRELARGSLFLDQTRIDALCAALSSRVKRLEEIVNRRRTLTPAVMDSQKADVPKDTAYSGGRRINEAPAERKQTSVLRQLEESKNGVSQKSGQTPDMKRRSEPER